MSFLNKLKLVCQHCKKHFRRGFLTIRTTETNESIDGDQTHCISWTHNEITCTHEGSAIVECSRPDKITQTQNGHDDLLQPSCASPKAKKQNNSVIEKNDIEKKRSPNRKPYKARSVKRKKTRDEEATDRFAKRNERRRSRFRKKTKEMKRQWLEKIEYEAYREVYYEYRRADMLDYIFPEKRSGVKKWEKDDEEKFWSKRMDALANHRCFLM